MELVSLGSEEQSVTDISFSLSRDPVRSKYVQSSPINPLNPFDGFSNGGYDSSSVSKAKEAKDKDKLYHSDTSSDSDDVSGYKSDDEHSDIDVIPEPSCLKTLNGRRLLLQCIDQSGAVYGPI